MTIGPAGHHDNVIIGKWLTMIDQDAILIQCYIIIFERLPSKLYNY